MRIPRRALAGLLAGTLALVGAPVGLSSPAGGQPTEGDERFVRRAHFDLLNDADPSPATVDAALAELSDVGVGAWLADLQRSEAGRGATVDDAFDAVLRRDADAAGRAFFVGQLASGLSAPRLTASLLASGEHYARRGGGTNDGWLDALYRDALGRAADQAGKDHFLGRLQAGATRGSIAAHFVVGAEGRTVLVRRLYTELLRRTGDAQGVQLYAELLRTGSSVERIKAILVASGEYRNRAAADLGDERIIVLTEGGSLVFTTTGDVEVVERTVAVSGLAEGARLLGIDVRPVNGVLYGVTDGGQVVTISSNGIATPLGAAIPGFDPSGGVGFDFNPMADALRIVTGTQNYRVNATTGALANDGGPDTPLAFAPGDRNRGRTPDASAAAYTNSTRGLPRPTETALYDIDEGTDSLVQQVPANDGTLVTIGRLHLDAAATNGFDISPDGGQNAYALLDTPHTGVGAWRIDLRTGEPRLISWGGPEDAIGLAVVGEEVVVPDETLFAVDRTGPTSPPRLISFSLDGDPAPRTRVVTGAGSSAALVGIDVRPATGVLYGINSNGQIYSFNTAGAIVSATALGTPIAGFDAADGVGFDFNPAADALRITNGDRNYRVRIADGVVVGEGTEPGTPGSLQYVEGDPNAGAGPDVTGAAYTNSQRTATLPAATQLFDIDESLDVLVRQDPANDGDLATIGSLGVDATAVEGFDVSGGLGQTAYAVLTVGGVQGIYRIDLSSGAATLIGQPPAGATAFAVG